MTGLCQAELYEWVRRFAQSREKRAIAILIPLILSAYEAHPLALRTLIDSSFGNGGRVPTITDSADHLQVKAPICRSAARIRSLHHQGPLIGFVAQYANEAEVVRHRHHIPASIDLVFEGDPIGADSGMKVRRNVLEPVERPVRGDDRPPGCP